MSLNLEKMSGAAIGRAIAAGNIDPVAVAEFFLERIVATRNPAFITVTKDRALREAKASTKRARESGLLGPLDGVPIAWKDLMDMAGTPTTGGTAIYRDGPIKDRDAPIVANLAAAGMVALGKTNLPDFAYSGLGFNLHYGTPVNPHDTKTQRIPGGSSSGAGVALASGLTPCAIGSDTGGSIRAPSSLNGVVGFKTTEGRIDKVGVLALSRTLDTVGPMAHSVEDCVLIDMALRGAVTTSVRRADLTGLRVIPHDHCPVGLGDQVGTNMERVLSRLSAAGAKIDRRPLPQIAEAREITAKHGALITVEGYAENRRHLESDAAKLIDPRILSRCLAGRSISAYDFLMIQRERERLIALLEVELGDALIVTPATPITAPAMAPLAADDELFRKTNLHVLYFCFIGNYFRMCGLALPSGRDKGGLPTGVQFLAKGGDDERLLSLGLGIERAIAEP